MSNLLACILACIRDGPLEKFRGGGGRGIFEPQEFFSLSSSSYEFFLGRSMNIFKGYMACMNFFFI